MYANGASIRRADPNLRVLRQVVASATSGRELHDRLVALNGSVLNEADQAQPLPQLKAQAEAGGKW
jgi:hypothetical protein